MQNDEIRGGRHPRRLSDVLGRVMRQMRVSDQKSAISLFSQWTSIVGESVAQHVVPIRLEKRKLTVEVDDPMWATQMKFLEHRVLSTLQEHIGDEVDSLDIRVRRSR